jgi:hypothetical protein
MLCGLEQPVPSRQQLLTRTKDTLVSFFDTLEHSGGEAFALAISQKVPSLLRSGKPMPEARVTEFIRANSGNDGSHHPYVGLERLNNLWLKFRKISKFFAIG